MFVQENLFGGEGRVSVWDLLGAAQLDPFRAVLACELAPGARVGTHVQTEFPELVVITSGIGTVEVDGQPRDVEAGMVVTLALGQTLAIANRSPAAALHYIIIKAALNVG